jgi:hypothetical protein
MARDYRGPFLFADGRDAMLCVSGTHLLRKNLFIIID